MTKWWWLALFLARVARENMNSTDRGGSAPSEEEPANSITGMDEGEVLFRFAMKAAVIVMAVLVDSITGMDSAPEGSHQLGWPSEAIAHKPIADNESITVMDFAHPFQTQGRRGHYWVLTPDVLIELAQRVNPYWELVASAAEDSKVGNGFTLVFQVNKSIPVMDFVPVGYAQGGYAVPEGGFFAPSAPSVMFVPFVDADQLEADALAAIDEIKGMLEEEERTTYDRSMIAGDIPPKPTVYEAHMETPAPPKPKRKPKTKKTE